jgi:hypothetical protein
MFAMRIYTTTKRYFNLLLLTTLVLFSFALTCNASSQPIALQHQPVAIVPTQYYLQKVIDSRADQSAVAWLIEVTPDHKKTIQTAVDLQSGVATAVHTFFEETVATNTQLRPITVRIKDFHISESASAIPGNVDGHLSIDFAYDFKPLNNPETIQILTYKSGSHYTRPVNNTAVIEPALRQALSNAAKYLNNWMDKEAYTNPKLASAFKVTFKDYNQPNADTVYYSKNRPLTFDDFKAPDPHLPSKYGGQVLPLFAYDEQITVLHSVINVDMRIKVWLAQSDCWVRPGSRSDYTLNHEQRHFDIVKIIAEQFKQRVKQEPLCMPYFDGTINAIYLDELHEMNVMQDAYDNETQHGLNQYAQQQWNERIDSELHKFGVI